MKKDIYYCIVLSDRQLDFLAGSKYGIDRMKVLKSLIDAAVIKDTSTGFFTELSSNDVYYSFGPGFRFSLPQFPLRMLLANTFQIIDGKTVWGNGKGPEWAFVLSFNITNR